MTRKRWRKRDYPHEADPDGTNQNWYALAVAILADKSIGKSLALMGVKKSMHMRRLTLGGEPLSNRLCYVLYRFCGLSETQIGHLLGLNGRNFRFKVNAYRREMEERNG